MARSGVERIPQPSIPEDRHEEKGRSKKVRPQPPDDREKIYINDRPKGWKREKPIEPAKPEPVTKEQWDRMPEPLQERYIEQQKARDRYEKRIRTWAPAGILDPRYLNRNLRPKPAQPKTVSVRGLHGRALEEHIRGNIVSLEGLDGDLRVEMAAHNQDVREEYRETLSHYMRHQMPIQWRQGVRDPKYQEYQTLRDTRERTARKRSLDKLKKEKKPVLHFVRKYLMGNPAFAALYALTAVGGPLGAQAYGQMKANGTRERAVAQAYQEHMERERQTFEAEEARVLRGEDAQAVLAEIDGLWDTKMKSRIARGPNTAVRRAEVYNLLEQELAEGRVHRLSLEDEMRESMGLQESNFNELGIVEAVTGDTMFDWHAYGEEFGLSSSELETAQRAARLITPAMIETVFLNEIESGGSGEQNLANWAARLERIGEAVALTPTQGDRYGIVGPGQETLTLDEDQSIGRMARHLSSQSFWYLNLPDDFTDMRGRAERVGHEEFRTSLETDAHIPRSMKEERIEVLLNAMYNIGLAVRDPQQHAALTRILDAAYGTGGDRAAATERFAEFMVMAHNNPMETKKALEAWYRRGANFSAPLHAFLQDHDSVIYDYGSRFVMNYPAMAAYEHDLRLRFQNVQVPTESERFARILEEIRNGTRQ